MTGVTCILASTVGSSGFAATMTVGSGNFVYLGDTYRWRGYVTAASIYYTAFSISGGSMSVTTFKNKTIVSMVWISDANSTTSGTVVLEFSGDVSGTPGFVADATVNGSSIGGSSAPFYNATTNTTTFTIGSAGVSNPFTIAGTDTITLT